MTLLLLLLPVIVIEAATATASVVTRAWHVAGRKEGLQLPGVRLNRMSSRGQPTRGGPSTLWFGEKLIIPHRKKFSALRNVNTGSRMNATGNCHDDGDGRKSGAERGEVTGGWRKMHNETSKFKASSSKGSRRTGNVASTGEEKCEYKMFDR
jgi:hypothetical protein